MMDVYGKCIFGEKLQFVNLKMLIWLIFFFLFHLLLGGPCAAPAGSKPLGSGRAPLRRGGGWSRGGGTGMAQASWCGAPDGELWSRNHPPLDAQPPFLFPLGDLAWLEAERGRAVGLSCLVSATWTVGLRAPSAICR